MVNGTSPARVRSNVRLDHLLRRFCFGLRSSQAPGPCLDPSSPRLPLLERATDLPPPCQEPVQLVCGTSSVVRTPSRWASGRRLDPKQV
jgi:hypothetical protein